MSQDAERMKRLIEFKKKLETRIVEMDGELKDLQATLETVNSILLEKGFRRPEISKEPSAAEAAPIAGGGAVPEYESSMQSQTKAESVIPLNAATGELLANLYAGADSLRVVPPGDKNFDVNTPPFTHFLVERVFLKMQERDSELARAGQLAPDKIFRYNIVRDGDVIREITVRNVDADRLRELKSSIRWTLEKMYEKMQSQS